MSLLNACINVVTYRIKIANEKVSPNIQALFILGCLAPENSIISTVWSSDMDVDKR